MEDDELTAHGTPMAGSPASRPNRRERGRVPPLVILLVLVVSGIATVLFAATRATREGCHDRNDFQAMVRLRMLWNCQWQMRDARAVDVDGDGLGEFGFVMEMTGSWGLRADARGTRRGGKLHPAILSPSLANLDAQGRVTKAGYHFRVLLPGSGCPAAFEVEPPRAGGATLRGVVDTDSAERGWVALAWPVAAGNSGTVCFLVDQGGDVYRFANEDLRFGAAAEPTTAVLPGGWRWGDALPPTFTGRDGSEWVRTP